jgi:hypothetical protein
MNQTIFEISTEYRDILADMELHAENNEGDITDFPLLDRLAVVEGDLSHKALNIAALIKELNAEAMSIAELGTSLVARATAKANRAERLKQYLKDNVPMNAVYEDARAKVSWAGNGGVRPFKLMPEVLPEDLPEKFQRKEITVKTEEVRKELEAGIVAGHEPEKTGEPLELKDESGKVLAVVKPRGKSLRIK